MALAAATTLPAAIQQFCTWLGYMRRASPHTCLAYTRDLTAIEAFLTQHLGQQLTLATWPTLTPTHMQSYVAGALHPRGKQAVASKSTLNRQLSSLRAFTKWLAAQGHPNPALANLRGLKNTPPKPKALNTTQTWQLLENLAPPPVRPQAVPVAQRRNFALFILLYGVGLRIAEALSLTRADVQGSSLTVTGKGNKQRQVPLPLPVQSALNGYLNATAGTAPDSPLFPSPSKPTRPITARLAQKVLQETRGKLGLPSHLTPHALRHSFATHLLHGGAGLRDVQELLGHASLATTQRYLAADTAQLIKVHSKAHPLK